MFPYTCFDFKQKGVYFRSPEAHRVLQRREQQVSAQRPEAGKWEQQHRLPRSQGPVGTRILMGFSPV